MAGFLSREARQDLESVVRCPSEDHGIARQCNALLLLDDGHKTNFTDDGHEFEHLNFLFSTHDRKSQYFQQNCLWLWLTSSIGDVPIFSDEGISPTTFKLEVD